MDSTTTTIAVAGVLAVPLGAAVRAARRHHVYGTPTERAAYEAMHTVSLAAPTLRGGLSPESARKSARHLRRLLGTAAVAMTDRSRILVWDGDGGKHSGEAFSHAANVLADRRVALVDWVDCGSEECPIRGGVVAPLIVDGEVVGTLAAYNSLTAIASFVRTDPGRARELLLEFADFTRYSFRRNESMTTVAEELRCIDCYFQLEQARFGDYLHLDVRVDPEVLQAKIPFLCLQPLVENAVRHGIRGEEGKGTVTVSATGNSKGYTIVIADDGIGMTPETAAAALAGSETSDSHALANIHARLRAAFGPDHGLSIDTKPGEGTVITMRIPRSPRSRKPVSVGSGTGSGTVGPGAVGSGAVGSGTVGAGLGGGS